MTSAAVDTDGGRDASGEPPAAAKRRTRPSRVALHAFLILTVLLWVSPILWAIFTAMRPYADTSAARLRLLAEASQLHELHERLHAVRHAALLLELDHRRDPGDLPDPALLVRGRVRRLSVQLLVQRPAAHLLHGGEPPAAAGGPPAAVSPLPLAAAPDLALGQRVLLRLVRRPDRDQRGVPDRLLHVRARQLHEDDPEVADARRPASTARASCASTSGSSCRSASRRSPRSRRSSSRSSTTTSSGR